MMYFIQNVLCAFKYGAHPTFTFDIFYVTVCIEYSHPFFVSDFHLKSVHYT